MWHGMGLEITLPDASLAFAGRNVYAPRMQNHRFMIAAASLLCAAWAATAQETEAPPTAEPADDRTAESYQEDIANYETREMRGWTVHVHTDLVEHDAELLKYVLFQLDYDFDVIEHAVAPPQLAQLKQVDFWIERQGAIVPGGMTGRGMCYHVSENWLTSHGILAQKTGGIEIVRAADFPVWRKNQPYMTLHELSHAYHRRLGHGNAEVRAAYDHAMDEGLYDAVLKNTTANGEPVRAYAATNPVEYFAELSEAYFGLNDFFPFTKRQLRQHDPEGFAVVEKMWSLSEDELAAQMRAASGGDGRDSEDNGGDTDATTDGSKAKGDGSR